MSDSGSLDVSASSRRSRLLLLGLLILLAVTYLAVRPTLNRMRANTERMNQEAGADQAEVARLSSLKNALDQAKQRVLQNPNDAQAQGELAQRCEEAGNIEEALLHAEMAARLQPRNVDYLLSVASLRQRMKRFDTAMDAYRQALEISPEEPRASMGLAYLYVQFGWTLQAEALLTPLAAKQPENVHVKVSLAMAYVQHADSAHAEQLLLDVKRLAPNDTELWTPLIDVYMKEKHYADALQETIEALRQTPDNKAVQLLQGEAYYYLRNLDAARQTLRHLLSVDPDNALAYYYLGLCAVSAGDIPEAIRQMEQSLRHDPDSVTVQRVLGQLYLRVHRNDEGRKLTLQANREEEDGQKHSRLNYQLANHPDSPDAHRQMAQVYEQQHDIPRAIVEWKQTLRYRPNDTEAHTHLRAALQNAGRSSEANSY